MIEQIYIKRAMRYGKDGTLDHEITSEDITGIPYEHSHKIGFWAIKSDISTIYETA